VVEYRSFFEKPPDTQWNIISLGGGVQSSAMALMAAKGEITPMPQAAIFADTQGEPRAVYAWLDWLEKQLPFPVHRVTAGSLAEMEMQLRVSKKSGRTYKKSEIPAFGKNPDGSKGIMGRKCTRDFKIQPIKVKTRELCGIKRGQKIVTVTQWIGISYDEMGRATASREPWSQTRFPLLEAEIDREGCLKWMRDNGFPEPPRSACLFCPFHSDQEWQRIKNGPADEWQSVIDFEKKMQKAATQCQVIRSIPYLHPSLKPIEEVEFKPAKAPDGQKQMTMHEMWNDIKNDCSGMCGV
jgi:hypothetical protein